MKKLLKKFLSPETIDILRTLKWSARGRDFLFKKEVTLPYKNFGNDADCCSLYLKGKPLGLIVYSVGIGDVIDFELQLVDQITGVQIYAFDPTPSSINWLSNQNLPPCFHFFHYAVTASDGMFDFYLPDNEEFISGSLTKTLDDIRKLNTKSCISVQGKKITSIMKELNHDHIDVLKLDIEGAEFDVLEELVTSKTDVRQICVDFHNRYMSDGKKKLKRLLKIMSDNGYKIFAVHERNKSMSFIKGVDV